METLKFSIHEFMVIMGILRERRNAGIEPPSGSVWFVWQERYAELDRDLEKLDMMQRADMLFDGKVTFQDVTRPMIEEVMSLADEHLSFEQGLINDGDLDADPDEVEIWKTLRLRLETSLEWEG